MITCYIKIKTDTEAHFKKIMEDINHNVKMGYENSECYYIWPNSYHDYKKFWDNGKHSEWCKLNHASVANSHQKYCPECGEKV